MRHLHVISSLALALTGQANAALVDGVGQTLTSWDCCKPACAWSSVLSKSTNARGYVQVCDKDDQVLAQSKGNTEQSSCSSTAGNAFLCSHYAPEPQTEDFSYGFAITDGSENCCKCFELTWTDGPARDKRMQVQVINEGGSTDNGRDFIILMPGGGVGPNTKGCDAQFGSSWGREYGGVESREDCENLPGSLQGGCYWRFNWARGDVNNWPIRYQQITCPDHLSQLSGCSSS